MVGDKPPTEFGRIPSRLLTATDRSVFPHSARMDSTARGSGGWWTRRISWPAFATGRVRKSPVRRTNVWVGRLPDVIGQADAGAAHGGAGGGARKGGGAAPTGRREGASAD